jgi:uncharacterized protein (TIGR02266 family)
MRILSAWFESGEDFLRSYNESIGAGALYYPTIAELTVGEQVLLEVRFASLPNRMLVRGKVFSIDLQKNGVWISFLSEDQETRDFIVDVARGDITVETKIHRRHQRYPIEIPVDWKANDSDDVFISCTEDLSAGGAFVRTLSPPPIGTPVALVLAPSSGKVLTISGKVSWTRQESGGEGMGVRFEQATSETIKALREALRKMDEGAVVGSPVGTPDDKRKFW